MAFTHSSGWRPDFGGILKSAGSGGLFGAMCVRYGSEDEPDTTGEYFDQFTDFAFKSAQMRVCTLFNHGLPIDSSAVAKRFSDAVFPDATIERVEGGLFGTIKLSPADPLQSAVARMIEAGALRFSSGSTVQFARRQGGRIVRWPIVELSVTARPAEPRLPKIRNLQPS
jgi:hypothetical protein